MRSFDGGMQVFLPRFFPKGTTIMRGGTWKGDANACSSGFRMLSGGYGPPMKTGGFELPFHTAEGTHRVN